MYLLLVTLLEFLFFFHYISIYLTIILAFFYLLWYFDGKEYTGERRWDAFRSMRIWKWLSPVEHVFPLKTDMSQTTGRKLLIFPNALTPSSLIWSIGLHGNEIQFGHHRAVHYIVPPLFMWIPIIRDVLLWSGAVTYSLYNPARSKYHVITNLLQDNRIVAYVPSRFYYSFSSSPHDVDDIESNCETLYHYPSDDLLEYICKQKVQIVPIHVQRELERYRFYTSPRLHWLQTLSLNYLDYPWPLCYWYRFYHPSKPHAILVSFGPIMSGNVYESVDALMSALKEQVLRMAQPIVIESQLKNTKAS